MRMNRKQCIFSLPYAIIIYFPLRPPLLVKIIGWGRISGQGYIRGGILVILYYQFLVPKWLKGTYFTVTFLLFSRKTELVLSTNQTPTNHS